MKSPDGFEDADSSSPRVLRRFAAEAWLRAEAGELDEEELYDFRYTSLRHATARQAIHEPPSLRLRWEGARF